MFARSYFTYVIVECRVTVKCCHRKFLLTSMFFVSKYVDLADLSSRFSGNLQNFVKFSKTSKKITIFIFFFKERIKHESIHVDILLIWRIWFCYCTTLAKYKHRTFFIRPHPWRHRWPGGQQNLFFFTNFPCYQMLSGLWHFNFENRSRSFGVRRGLWIAPRAQCIEGFEWAWNDWLIRPAAVGARYRNPLVGRGLTVPCMCAKTFLRWLESHRRSHPCRIAR